MSIQRDAFTWVDTGAVAYPSLHSKILELTMPSLLVKGLFPEFPLVAGKTATFVKEAGSRSAAISEISEGVEIPMDFTPLSYVINLIRTNSASLNRVALRPLNGR